MKIILFIIVSLNQCFSCSWKMRARENYEINSIETSNEKLKYKGLSNTINMWCEKPYDYSIGLAYSSIFSNIETKELASFGKEIKLMNISAEYKYFMNDFLKNFFARPSIGYAKLRPDVGASKDGWFSYLGLGYEYPFKKFGLSLEVAYKYPILKDDIKIKTIQPSLGFHFYKMI